MEIAAILLSPLIAVLVSMLIQHLAVKRQVKRQDQLNIFYALIASRHNPLSEEHVKALNLIDVVFAKVPSVRRLWHEYFDKLADEGLNNTNGYKMRANKLLELITEMGRSLGYRDTFDAIDVDRVYIPIGWEQAATKQAEHTEEFRAALRVIAESRTVLPE